MALSVEKIASGREYKVKHMSLANFGCLEVELIEVEMFGLMSCHTEFGPSQPFKGARITDSLHMTIQIAVLTETLTALSTWVRWCSCNIFSTHTHAAAAIARTDYFIKAHTSPNVLWAERPEDMTTSRQAYKVDENNPGSDLAGETVMPPPWCSRKQTHITPTCSFTMPNSYLSWGTNIEENMTRV